MGERGCAEPGAPAGPDAYVSVLEQLEELSAAKVAALQAPGQVLLKLAATGFGVRLPGGGGGGREETAHRPGPFNGYNRPGATPWEAIIANGSLRDRFEICVPPEGFEPSHLAPEASALSPELWGLSNAERLPVRGGACDIARRRVPVRLSSP